MSWQNTLRRKNITQSRKDCHILRPFDWSTCPLRSSQGLFWSEPSQPCPRADMIHWTGGLHIAWRYSALLIQLCTLPLLCPSDCVTSSLGLGKLCIGYIGVSLLPSLLRLLPQLGVGLVGDVQVLFLELDRVNSFLELCLKPHLLADM